MSPGRLEPRFYPIVYVRGYAGSDDEVEDTVADPFMGFNLGSTKLRQRWKGDIQRLYFESPLIRLMKDHGYQDVYRVGDEMPDGFPISPRSVFIYRYYDRVSRQLPVGEAGRIVGERGEIVEYARGLSELIATLRDRICKDNEIARRDFRVHLVAHSMGGLVCRCFLQHTATSGDGVRIADPKGVRGCVDRVFTYATPHNGIDLEIIGNIPGFFTRNNADNFNRRRMRSYLSLPDDAEDVDDLNGEFDPDRFFCLVGTNRRDYEVAGGWARRVVGPMSDGLVRIKNATVAGRTRGGAGSGRHAPRAFVYRSHSGHFGVVNSEEGYQNLTRFLFGDIRVDGVLEVLELTLPPAVQKAYDEGKRIRASYHFEVVVRVRRARWDLHRRLVAEESAIFREFDDLFPREEGKSPRHPHLFSQFLAGWATKKGGRSLGFCLDLGILVPEYEIDGALWLDQHFEGGHLFREKINLIATPPRGEHGWRLSYGLDSRTPNRAPRRLEPLSRAEAAGLPRIETRAEDILYRLSLEQKTRPGFRGNLVLRARPWR